MDRYFGIGEAAKVLGVSITTLRRWEARGKIQAEHTAGGHRRYDLAKLRPELYRASEAASRKTFAYARDVNAAINLRNYAVSSTVSACGGEGAGLRRKTKAKPAPVKQEINAKEAEYV